MHVRRSSGVAPRRDGISGDGFRGPRSTATVTWSLRDGFSEVGFEGFDFGLGDVTLGGVGEIGLEIGENPIKLRAGKMIILAQSGFVPDELRISAASPGLLPAKVSVKTEPVPADVDMPKDLPAKQPTGRYLTPDSSLRPLFAPSGVITPK